MCSGSCSATSPLSQFLKNTSPQALQQAALKPKDPLDPKQLLSPTPSTDASTSVSAPKAAGTGLLVDTSA